MVTVCRAWITVDYWEDRRVRVTATRVDFVEASAEVIDVLSSNGESTSNTYNMLLVAGAIRRQLRKRYGSDDLSLISSGIIDQAFWNEMVRCVRSWPIERDFVRPTTFFRCAQTLVHMLAESDLCDELSPLNNWVLPHPFDDTDAHVTVWLNRRILFACPSTLRGLGLMSEESIESFRSESDLVDQSDANRFFSDVEKLLSQEHVNNPEYCVTIPFKHRVKILMASRLIDDDCRYVGNIWVTKWSDPHVNMNGSKLVSWVKCAAAPAVAFAFQSATLTHVIQHCVHHIVR